MARGNQKSSTTIKASPVAASLTEAEAIGAMNRDSRGPTAEAAAKRVIDEITTNPFAANEALRNLRSFSDALDAYQSNKHNEVGGHKARRKELVEAFRKLPDYIQKAMTVPDDLVKSAQEHLVRGGDHASRPGPDGEIIASFTMDKSVAEMFPMWENVKQNGAIYSLKDTETWGGVINIAKASVFRKALKAEADKAQRSVPVSSDKYDLAHDAWPTPPRLSEAEYIVYGIKWRPEVDTQEWRDDNSNSARTLKTALHIKQGT